MKNVKVLTNRTQGVSKRRQIESGEDSPDVKDPEQEEVTSEPMEEDIDPKVVEQPGMFNSHGTGKNRTQRHRSKVGGLNQ